MVAYYNEFDEKAAAWLRELIARGLIADGVVDTRSIEDVEPRQLAGFTQCHFFAGIGVWSYALRRAGISDATPVWTGSCPCQPFSAAGQGGGFDDERHLWPAWQWLIEQRRPRLIFGEQVASKDAEPWLDLVQADVEAMGYAFGACAFPSAGVGAPHIRDRTYWVADADIAGPQGRRQPRRERGDELSTRLGGMAGGLADADGGNAGTERQQRGGEQRQQPQDRGASRLADAKGDGHERAGGLDQSTGWDGFAHSGPDGGLANADSNGAEREPGDAPEAARLQEVECEPEHHADVSERGGADHDRRGSVRCDGVSGIAGRPSPTNGFWATPDWLHCRDGKWRAVEPGTFPLAHGAPARVGRLRGYGNAINAEAAQVFIESYLETHP